MGFYVEKSTSVVKAFQLSFGEDLPEWLLDAVGNGDVVLYATTKKEPHRWDVYFAEIKTQDGVKLVNPGEYIVKCDDGELYPYKPDLFEAIYKKVGEDQ